MFRPFSFENRLPLFRVIFVSVSVIVLENITDIGVIILLPPVRHTACQVGPSLRRQGKSDWLLSTILSSLLRNCLNHLDETSNSRLISSPPGQRRPEPNPMSSL